MSNHLSLYDIPMLMLAFPGSLRMIAKKELFRVPLFGSAMKAAGFVSLDRENKEQAKQAMNDAKESMNRGMGIWLSPEGTRSRDGKLGEFKKGGFMIAYQTEAEIVPVALIGTNKVLPADTFQFNANQKVTVRIGKPICVADYGIRKRKELMADVEASMRELLSPGSPESA